MLDNSDGSSVMRLAAMVRRLDRHRIVFEVIASNTIDIPQNINFAIKASSVIDLLDANSVRYHSESLQRELPVEVLTQKMKEYTVRIECN